MRLLYHGGLKVISLELGAEIVSLKTSIIYTACAETNIGRLRRRRIKARGILIKSLGILIKSLGINLRKF